MYYLAIDIGASSGRHILGSVENGKLVLNEIYRFENGLNDENGTLVWDIDKLFAEVKAGIAKCKELGITPETVSIDTWGVDYVLLDRELKEILPAVSYRDSRTEKSAKAVLDIVSQKELYAKTGIQRQNYNTVYQLYADKQSGKLDKAEHFLMIPEYLSFKLTGVIKREYTNASTTNLVNAQSKTWDFEIVEKLGLPAKIFEPLNMPGTVVGELKPDIAEEIGFNTTVVLCPSHDTASAVAACPINNESVYISSGTWSLIGTESDYPVLSDEALEANFTNEGGIEYKFRFLKNIMGMWLFQNIRKNIEKKLSYDEMMHLAEQSTFCELVDPNDSRFLAPDNMVDAVREALGKPELPLADVLSCVYNSLAHSYKRAIEEIEHISGKRINFVNIVGGGSRDMYLNRLTSEVTGKKVYIGLMEATATGNLMSQIMYKNNMTLDEARNLIKNTFNVKEVQ